MRKPSIDYRQLTQRRQRMILWRRWFALSLALRFPCPQWILDRHETPGRARRILP